MITILNGPKVTGSRTATSSSMTGWIDVHGSKLGNLWTKAAVVAVGILLIGTRLWQGSPFVVQDSRFGYVPRQPPSRKSHKNTVQTVEVHYERANEPDDRIKDFTVGAYQDFRLWDVPSLHHHQRHSSYNPALPATTQPFQPQLSYSSYDSVLPATTQLYRRLSFTIRSFSSTSIPRSITLPEQVSISSSSVCESSERRLFHNLCGYFTPCKWFRLWKEELNEQSSAFS